MAQFWPLLVGLVVLLGSNFSTTGATNCRPAVCSQSGGNGIFKYQTGNSYTYTLEGQTITSLPEQQGDAVELELSATAEVNFGALCTNTLKLSNVKVQGPNAKKYSLQELETYPVRFSFNDGQIEPEICSDKEDSHTALNIKRAVISLFQVSTPTPSGTATKHEVDVFGGCPTVFEITASGSDTNIVKTRNLNKCSYREGLRQRVPSSAYVSKSELQNVPLMDANYRSELKVSDGILQSAHSHELYLYRPFSNKDAGATTVVHTKLTYVSVSPAGSHAVAAETPTSLIFDSPHGFSPAKSSTAAIVTAMQACANSETDTVTTETASEFRDLVEVLRASSKDHILTVHSQVKAGAGFSDKKAARLLFLQALLHTSTGDSVEVITELLKSNELDEKFHPVWYKSLAFVRHATPASLSAAASLLDLPNTPNDVYLAVGALAGRYCSEHTCEGLKEFDELIAKLSKPLAGGCKCSSYEEENSVIAALRGLENARGLNEAAAELVRVCISDSTVPARVRVAALETYKSDACQPQLKKASLEILTNRQEDSEIRIKAYLAAVECPCGKCANTIKEVLESETVNQVGSFIVSHLRNIRASNNPEKALQKQHLSEIRTTKRFPFDMRKFSRNYEFSGLLDAINVGSTAEANVIYSQQSYLPRSVSLNLTTEIFGHSVNLLEIGTRAQNLDRLFETILGPNSYMNTHEYEDILKDGSHKLKGLRQRLAARFKKTFRTKRSVSNSDLEAFRKVVYQPTENRNMNLDLTVKMFGNTLGIANYHGDTTEFTPEKMIDKLFDCLDTGVGKAKNFDYDIRPHAMFMESDLVYPTGLGLPLKLSISGSAAVRVKFNGKVDFQAIAKDPKNAQFQFEAIPSASVEMFCKMSVDAHAVEAGIKVAGVLHTSTGVNVDVKSVDGTGVDLTLGLPVTKQDLIDFKSEILTTVRERGQVAEEKELLFNTKRKDYEGCFDQLKPILGVTFCGKVGVPAEGALSKAALFPLNGGSKLSIGLECNDVKTYKFRSIFNINDPNRKSIEFLIDTPNSETKRKVEVVMEAILQPERELRIKLVSPFKTAMAELIRKDTNKENSLMGRVLNDDQEYYFKLGADISGSESHAKYTPLFEYRMPNQKSSGKKKKAQSQDFNVQGSVIVDKEGSSRKLSFEDFAVVTPAGKIFVIGWLQQDPTYISSDLKVELAPDNTISLIGKAEKLGPSNFKVKYDVQVSRFPDVGVSIDWLYNRGSDQLDSTLKVVHGQDLKSDQACVTSIVHAKYHYENLKDFDFSSEGSVTYPLLGVDISLKSAIQPKSVSYGLSGKYDQYVVKSDAHAKTGIKNPGDYDVAFEAKVADNHLNFVTTRDIVSPSENKFYTKLDVKPGGKYELTTDTVCQYETNHVIQNIVAVALIEGQSQPYKLDYGLDMSSVKFDGHVKACIGDVDYVNLVGTFERGTTRSGNVQVLFKDHLEGAGKYSYESGKGGSLDANLNLKKVDRNMKANGNLVVTGSNHVANLDVLFDEKDPSKKIHFETVSDIQSNSLDSKNTLIIFDYKTLFNVKGDLTGKLTDGRVKGNADLTLPNKRYITASLDRVLHVHVPESDGTWDIEITSAEKKGAPARSLTIQAKGEKVDRQKGLFDNEITVTFKNTQGKDVSYKVAAKNLRDGEKRIVEFQGQIQGSLLDMAPMIHVKADSLEPILNYWVKVNLAADSNLELSGKYQCGKDRKVPYELENTLELNLPTGDLKNVKVTEKWTLILGEKGAPCELKATSSSTFNSENTVKLDCELKATKESGQGKLIVVLPNEEPRVIKGSYNIGKGPDIEREGSLTFTQGSKEGSLDFKVKVPQEKNSLYILLNAKTPWEKLKDFEMVVNSLRTEKSVDTDITITSEDKKAVITNKYGLDWKNPVFQLGIVHPEGKSYIGYYFLRREGAEKEFESEFKWQHNDQSGLTKTLTRYVSVQDFTVTIDMDWPQHKINQAQLVITSSPAVKGGKSISIVKTEAGETTVTGKLDYSFQDGSEGTLFEANGNLKVRGQNRKAKIVFKKDVISTSSEDGIQYTFTANIGDKTMENIAKRSNKELRLFGKACEKEGSCGVVEYCSKYNIDGVDFNNEMTAYIDFTGLGSTADYSLTRVTKKTGLEFLHKVELNLKKAEKFLFKIEANDKESSVQLVTPSREMSAEAKHNLNIDSKNKQHITYKYELSVWLDKGRQPDKAATLLIDNDYLRSDDSIVVQYSAKGSLPGLGKDLAVKGKTTLGGSAILGTTTEFDLFIKKGQKIVINGKILKNEISNGFNLTSTWDIKSSGQNLDIVWESHAALSPEVVGCGSALIYKDQRGVRDLGFGAEATASKFAIFAKSPKDILVDINGAATWKKNLPTIDIYFNVAGCKAILGKLVFEDNKVSYTMYKKATPDREIYSELSVDVDKMTAHSFANWVIGSETKRLYSIGCTWADKTKPEVYYSLDTMKDLVEYMRGDLKTFVDEVQTIAEELRKEAIMELTDVEDQFKKASLNVKPVVQYYQDEIKAIKDEITSNESVTEFGRLIKKLIGSANAVLAQVTEVAIKVLDKAIGIYAELSRAIISSLKRIIPTAQESCNKIFKSLVTIFDTLGSVALDALKGVLEIVQKYEGDIKQVLTAIVEVGNDFLRLVGKTVSNICREIKDIVNVVVDQVKALPMVAMLQDRIDELKAQISHIAPPAQLAQILQDVTHGLQDTLPTAELREFVETVSNYLNKLLKKEKVDYVKEWKIIYSKGISAIKSVLVLFKGELSGKDADASLLGITWPFSLKALYRIPMWATVHLSPFNYLRSDDLPSLRDYIRTYWANSLNPEDYIPPFDKYGAIVDTSHFFTFDKRHFTFKPSCSVLLVQDATNGNFSLVLNVEGGKFKSMQISDGKDIAEITATQTLLVNGQPTEYPYETGSLNVWRRYHSINMKVRAGLQVKIDSDHHVTMVRLDGFYHGQVRGLLGDANNEEYDDFRLPDGKITTSVTEFGNAYQVGGGCSAGVGVEHSHGHEAVCTTMFSANSPLRPAFKWVCPDAFREACDHLSSETPKKKQEYACRIAAAYVKFARKRGSYISLPNVCGQCKAPAKKFPIGEYESVSSPAQMADIIVIVEQVTNVADIYKDLVSPLVGSLSSDLKSKGITDVKFSLIGYGHPKQKWPAHHTIGGKIGFDGKVQLEFGDSTEHPEEWGPSDEQKWKFFYRKFSVEFGLTKISNAIKEASLFPFRAGASKAVVLVTGTRCERVLPLGYQKLRQVFFERELLRRGISMHVISSMDGFNIIGSNDDKRQKSVVGFDDNTAYTFADGKKKTLEGAGDEDLLKDIEYTKDICIESALKSNGGAAYNGANFIEGKSGQRKQFLQVVTNKLASSLSSEFTEECECTYYHGLYPETKCLVTSWKDGDQQTESVPTKPTRKGDKKKPKA